MTSPISIDTSGIGVLRSFLRTGILYLKILLSIWKLFSEETPLLCWLSLLLSFYVTCFLFWLYPFFYFVLIFRFLLFKIFCCLVSFLDFYKESSLSDDLSSLLSDDAYLYFLLRSFLGWGASFLSKESFNLWSFIVIFSLLNPCLGNKIIFSVYLGSTGV